MKHEIIRIKTAPSPSNKFVERIEAVMISNGMVLTIPEVIDAIDNLHHEFFYTTFWNAQTPVEVVDSVDGKYIRTKANHSTSDNLLSLPKF